MADVKERNSGTRIMTAYEDAIHHTATDVAPWYVVPADHKWFTRLVVSAAIVDALEELDLRFPTIDDARRAELAHARASLMKRIVAPRAAFAGVAARLNTGTRTRVQRKRAPTLARGALSQRIIPGSDLLSHTPAHAVPSAVAGLTSVFGMGTGVTLPL